MHTNTTIELCPALAGKPNAALVALIEELDKRTNKAATYLGNNPTPASTQEFCNATLNMSLLVGLPVTKEEHTQVMQGLFNYIGLRFGKDTRGTCIVMGHVLGVTGLFGDVSTKKLTVDEFIDEIDGVILAVLQAGPMNQRDFTGLVGRVVTRADVGKVIPGNEAILTKRLVEYVTKMLNPPVASKLTIGGETFTLTTDTPNIDSMYRSNVLSRTQDMFRPFLVRSIYSYLVDLACNGQTTTYEAIANQFSLPNRGNQLGSTLSPLLSSIYHFCYANQQPHLTAIVVRKSGEDVGLPGKGFWDLYQATEDRHERRLMTADLHSKVFAYWGQLGK